MYIENIWFLFRISDNRLSTLSSNICSYGKYQYTGWFPSSPNFCPTPSPSATSYTSVRSHDLDHSSCGQHTIGEPGTAGAWSTNAGPLYAHIRRSITHSTYSHSCHGKLTMHLSKTVLHRFAIMCTSFTLKITTVISVDRCKH